MRFFGNRASGTSRSVVGARLIKDPSPVLERLTATRATFTLRDAERVIGEKVREPEQQQAVLEAQRTLDTAARRLAQAPQEIVITRDAGAHRDEQQRRAYAYAVADDARLKVVTGIPGAGKTTLIADVAAAYEEAGYRVRAVSIANTAVQVLEQETNLPARSIAKELHEWGQDRGQLGARDVLIVDEVSTLGTAQGAELLRGAHDRGATVLAFGDDKKFQAVAHGNALAFMQRAVGENAIDLTQTRRQHEEWQWEATHAARRRAHGVGIGADRTRQSPRVHARRAQSGVRVAQSYRTRRSEHAL
jgi:ATP-dependent exoDNAse (exonuclease V) alpha subunit